MGLIRLISLRDHLGFGDGRCASAVAILREYAEGSAKPVLQAIEDARSKRIEVDLDQFLAKRFGKSLVPALKAVHETEEGRPIETLWDVTVAATAHARSLPNRRRREPLRADESSPLPTSALSPAAYVEKLRRNALQVGLSRSSTAVDERRGLRRGNPPLLI